MAILDQHELRNAALALAKIHAAGEVDLLREEVAAAWVDHVGYGIEHCTPGQRLDIMRVAGELEHLVGVPRGQAVAAACRALLPSREQIALDLIQRHARGLSRR